MNKNNQVEQDKLEQEQKHEFGRLQMQERAERQKSEIMEEQKRAGKETRIESKNQTRAKVVVGNIGKTKKNFKTIVLILRVIFTSGSDIAAWMQLVKERPLLTIIVVVCLILLVIAVFVGLVVLVMYLFCQGLGFVGGAVSWAASFVTGVPDFCSCFK